jgi:diguanylate cyclase (GGDEF)-like protein/PAS domain S-box-containing protein
MLGPMTAANVLLISASPHQQAEVRSALESIRSRTCKLEIATKLAEVLARLKTRQLDMILLDLDLPDSQGITSFLRVQPRATNIPIVVLVAEDEGDIGNDLLKRGALEILRKDQLSGSLIDRLLRYATERTHTLRSLRASEQRYRELFYNVTAGVFQTTPDGKFMAANPALVRMLGYDCEDELIALNVSRDIYVDPEQRDNWARTIAERGQVRNAELLLKRKDGSRIVVLENSRAVLDADGHVLFYEGTLTDITVAHDRSKQLSYEAAHDPLTGLVNRREFEARLQRAMESSQATAATHVVCFLDLDRFKVINDTAGHVAGDEVLRQLAQLLQHKVRAKDVVARLGGDEFAVLLHACSMGDGVQIANTLIHSIAEHPFVWGASRFTVGVSIGLVPIDNTFRRIAQVMNAADTACYAAKEFGRGRLYIYEEDAGDVARRQGEMEWVTRARNALSDNRLYLDAQKIMPLTARGKVVPHYELLVRMRDETGRSVPSGAFLPAVERHNLSVPYDRWVFDTSLRWLGERAGTLHPGSRLFINLSRDSAIDSETIRYVSRAFAQTRIDPRRLGFEVAESIAISNLPRVNLLIAELRKLGCAFGLDDFGSGVSSFACLKALPADYVKIDGMFVGKISHDKVDYAMARSIMEISHAMGKKVVAELVESEAVLAKLREMGIDYAQGFVIGHPQPLEELEAVRMTDLLAS